MDRYKHQSHQRHKINRSLLMITRKHQASVSRSSPSRHGYSCYRPFLIVQLSPINDSMTIITMELYKDYATYSSTEHAQLSGTRHVIF